MDHTIRDNKSMVGGVLDKVYKDMNKRNERYTKLCQNL